MKLKSVKLSIVVALIAVSSCAAGDGLSAAGFDGWGTGLKSLGSGLILLLVFDFFRTNY